MYIPIPIISIITILILVCCEMFLDIRTKERASQEKYENAEKIDSLKREICDLSEKNYQLEKENTELKSKILYLVLCKKLHSQPSLNLYGYTMNELADIMLEAREYNDISSPEDIDYLDMPYAIKVSLCANNGYLDLYQNLSYDYGCKRLLPNGEYEDLSDDELSMLQRRDYDFILDSIADSELVKK